MKAVVAGIAMVLAQITNAAAGEFADSLPGSIWSEEGGSVEIAFTDEVMTIRDPSAEIRARNSILREEKETDLAIEAYDFIGNISGAPVAGGDNRFFYFTAAPTSFDRAWVFKLGDGIDGKYSRN